MSMNDKDFESFLWALENTSLSWAADDLRGRDNAQREALARVEAERDTAIVQMQNIRTNRDRLNKHLGDTEFNLCIAQAQLAEAVRLLREYGHSTPGVHIIQAFIDRIAQAEHGDEES